MKKTVILSMAVAAGLVLPATVRASTYATTILADSPALYYRLGDTTGTTAFDSSGGGHNGTYSGAYNLNQTGAITTDPGNPAVQLNPGTSSSGFIDSSFVLNPTSSFTVDFWLKLPTLNDGHTEEDVLSQRNGTGTGRSVVYWDDANQRMASNLGGSSATDFWTSSSGVTAGSYCYVAYVYDSVAHTVTWYKNGVVDGTISGVVAEAANGDIFIGQDKFLDGVIAALNGTLDEFAIYNSPLSATQIATHFGQALVPEPSSVLLGVVGAGLLWRRCSAHRRSSR